MENIVLSIEQMKELEELGIDTSNASMLWTAIVDADYNPIDWIPVVRRNKNSIEELRREFPLTYKEGNIYYAYTLTEILNMLPNTIKTYAGLMMWKDIHNEYHLQYICETPDLDNYYQSPDFHSISLLEASFNICKWCKQNNYI